MEPSNDLSLFFCAGSNILDNNGTSQGVLAAVRFDKSMQLITEQPIREADIQACTALRRFPASDDLLVGGYKHILLVTWNGMSFVVNNIIENVHTSKHSAPSSEFLVNFVILIFSRYCE